MPGYRFTDDDLSDCNACSCGGRPELIIDFVDDFEVRCTKCHKATRAYIDPDDAVKAWQNEEAYGKLDLIIDDVAAALSGEIEYILFDNDYFWMVNQQSCDCDEIIIKFKGKDKYYLIKTNQGLLDIICIASFNPSTYNIKFTPPENISVLLTSIHYNKRIPKEMKFRYGDRYLFFLAYEDNCIITTISQYDIFEEDNTLIPEQDDSRLFFEILPTETSEKQ